MAPEGDIFVTESCATGGTIWMTTGLEIPPPVTLLEGLVTRIIAKPGAEMEPSGAQSCIRKEALAPIHSHWL